MFCNCPIYKVIRKCCHPEIMDRFFWEIKPSVLCVRIRYVFFTLKSLCSLRTTSLFLFSGKHCMVVRAKGYVFSVRADSAVISTVRNASVNTVILASPHNISLQDNSCYRVLHEFSTFPFNSA